MTNDKKEKSSILWVTIYDFLDEILGSIVPGAYFCLLFYILADILGFFSDTGADTGLITLSLLVLSYVIGTAFRRSDMKTVDKESANYIFYRNIGEENGFAFSDSLQCADFEIFTAKGFKLGVYGNWLVKRIRGEKKKRISPKRMRKIIGKVKGKKKQKQV